MFWGKVIALSAVSAWLSYIVQYYRSGTLLASMPSRCFIRQSQLTQSLCNYFHCDFCLPTWAKGEETVSVVLPIDGCWDELEATDMATSKGKSFIWPDIEALWLMKLKTGATSSQF